MGDGCRDVWWCAGGHRCQFGEHRSNPQVFRERYGSLVATRVRVGRRRDYLEVRASVRLPDGDEPDTARLLLLALDLAVRDVLAGRLARARAAYRRLTGVRVRG